MTERIKRIAEEVGGISGFKINRKTTESCEMFFVHERLETQRATDTEDLSLTVYVRHDGKIGEGQVSLFRTETDGEIKDKISLACENALLVFNDDYELLSPETYEGEIESNISHCEPSELCAKIKKACSEANVYEGGSINALEIFVKKETREVINSLGLYKKETKYSAEVEAIPTFTEGEESVELYEMYSFGEFSEEDVKEEIGLRMREVRDRCKATVPEEKPAGCAILIRPEEITNLFGMICQELNYYSVYSGSNAFKVGDRLQSDKAHDKINVWTLGKSAGVVDSASFDSDGSEIKEKQIIKDGEVVSYYGASRYAQYLGMENTGDARIIKLSTGSATRESLWGECVLECISLSGIQVDVYNDYIGGEIRLAYLVRDGVTVPVTGISIAGKLSEALSNVRFSDKAVARSGYTGPDFAVLYGFEIV